MWVTDRNDSFVIHRAGCQHLRMDLDIAHEGEADDADAFLADIRSWRTDECGFEEHFAIAKCAR